jgi:hypothetical protein
VGISVVLTRWNRLPIGPSTKELLLPHLFSDSNRLAHILLHHLIRILILPDPKKDRLSESVVSRPLREFDLADHYRSDPVSPPHFSVCHNHPYRQ